MFRTADMKGPVFVGADFSSLPGISAFGAFARVVRLNHINPKGFFSAFGLSNRRDDDLSRRLTFSEASRDKVAEALSLASSTTLDAANWLPFQGGSGCLEASWSFRYCPACLRQGFHTLLHQLPWVTQCPWHRTRLKTKCAVCGGLLTLRGEPGCQLLICSKGHDMVNEMVCCADKFDQVDAAAAFIERYLSWAAEQRAQCVLIPPEGATTSFEVMRSAIVLPRTLRDCCQETGLTSSTNQSLTLKRKSALATGVHDLPSALAKWSSLRQEVATLDLPVHVAPGFVDIACRIANRLPPESLSDAEISLFFDRLERQPDKSFKPAKRASHTEISFLPPFFIGEMRFIHRSTLSKSAAQAAARLLALVMGEAAMDDPPEESSQHLLLSVLASILKRAYAEGTRVVLSRYIPSLFDSKRDRPRLTEPWILAWKDGQQLAAVTIVWAKRKWLP